MSLSTLLEGTRLHLTPLSNSDVPTIARWQLDSEYLRLLDANPAYPKNESQIADWLREGQRGRDNFLFGIRVTANDDLIGFVELGEVMWTHRNAWLAIAIGERDYRGRGYGYEAMSLTLDFVFRELNLHRIQLTVFSYNEAAIRLYEKLGFHREGVFREHLERDGQRFDMYLYGILKREWVE
ncbi:MAG: GNAT family protein [Anaerolineae bacterium]